MIIVKEAKSKITKLWGTASIVDRKYRFSKYLLRCDVLEGQLILNVTTGELVLIDTDELADLENKNYSETEIGCYFIAHHYLIPQDSDESIIVDQFRTVLRKFDSDKGIYNFTILPTTNCNARCFYCYEAGLSHVNMSADTADQVVAFIEKHRGNHDVAISWFGGEPTIASDRINQICEKLEEKEISFNSTMISNGYLLGEQLVDDAKNKWHLNSIQITLDGTEDIYNSTKKYCFSKGSPYKVVLHNIKLLLEADIRVNVRMNLGTHNSENLRALIEELKENFSDYNKFYAYAHPLFESCGFDPVQYEDGEYQELLNKQMKLREQLSEWVDVDRYTELPHLQSKHCMADGKNSVIIYPDGSLAKCEHFPDENLATIWDDDLSGLQLKKWNTYLTHEYCKDCPLYPKCTALDACPNSEICNEASKKVRIEKYKLKMVKTFQKKQKLL